MTPRSCKLHLCLSAIAMSLALTACKKSTAVDDLFESPPVDTVIVEVPEDLQVTINTPSADGKNVGYQVYMSGGCTLPGATVEFRGGATGFTACQANNTWEANVDVSSAAVGSVTVNVVLVDDDNESGSATRVLNKTNSDCDTSTARAATFAAGNGSLATPYSICTATQFNNIRYNLTSQFIIRNDIDLNGSAFQSIPASFEGTLDGDDFILKRLFIYDLSGNDQGLFRGARNGATIKDLTLESASVSGPAVVGILIGRVSAGSVTINNVDITGAVTGTTDYVGGMVGHVAAGGALTVLDSNVTLTNFSGRNYGGGILGSSAAGAGAIVFTNLTTSGTILMTNSYAGGIAGYIPSVTNTFTNITSTSDVTVNGGVADNYAGGLIGHMAGGNIDTCSSSGRISATSNYVGGLVAHFAGTKIWNCEFTGSIRGDSTDRALSYVGGLVGYASANTTDIYRSTAKVDIIVTGVNVGTYFGGLGGRIFGGNVIESHAIGDTTAGTRGVLSIDMGDDATTGPSQIGGAFGRIDVSNGFTLTITDSDANVDVTAAGHNTDTYAGGYVGYLVTPDGVAASTINVTDSSASGDVDAYNRSVGGWAGQIYVSRAGSSSSLTNVRASGDVTVTSNNSITPHYVGGLVGIANTRDAAEAFAAPGGHVWNNVHATGDVSVDSGAVGGNYVGGLVGYFIAGRTNMGGGTSTISYATATGSVSAVSTSTAISYVGGLIGRMYASNTANVTLNSTGGQSFATGNVTGNGSNVGGLIGNILTGTDADAVVTDVYSNGNVSGWTNVGGAFGYMQNGGGTATMNISDVQSHDSNAVTAAPTVTGSINSVGGFAGRAESTTTSFLIDDCEAIANVTSSGGNAGGFIGQDRDNVDISNSSASGSVISPLSYVGGFTGGSTQTGRDWSNVEATGNVTATTTAVGATNLFVGGLSGYMRGTITGGRATGDVLINLSGASTVVDAYVGGLVGFGNTLNVTNSYAKGDVSFNTLGAGTQLYVGGLIGREIGTVSNSFATGDVDGGRYTGGLIGYHRTGTVSNTFAAGNVSGTREVGGLIGDFDGAAGSLTLSYALGSTTRNSGAATDRFGQLVGYCNGGVGDAKVTNSYYNTTSSTIDAAIVTPQTACNSATPARALTDTQMRAPGTGFATFDFVGTASDDWRYPTSFTKKGSIVIYPYPIPYWALP